MSGLQSASTMTVRMSAAFLQEGDGCPRYGSLRDTFISDVDVFVCEHVNKTFGSRLNIGDLRNRCFRKPHPLARYICAFIRYHHPKTRAGETLMRLAEAYSKDHTTLGYGIRQVSDRLIERRSHPSAQILISVCEALQPFHGYFDYMAAAQKTRTKDAAE